MNDLIVLVIILVTGFFAWLAKGKKETFDSIPERISRWYKKAQKVSIKTGVPVELILAVIRQESNGERLATGSAGEVGLMQLKQIAVTDLIQNGYNVEPIPSTDGYENILQGAYFLKLQKKRAGTWYDALRAYNQGFYGMNRGSGVQRSQNYAQSVMNHAVNYGFR